MKNPLTHRLKKGITSPGNEILIINEPGVISNTLTVELRNINSPTYTEKTSFPNNIEVWNFLKTFNEIGGDTD